MSSRCDDDGNEGGPYIEYPTPDGGVHRMPTILPIPVETIELLDLDTAVLVVTNTYLAKTIATGGMLNTLDVHPMRRLKYIGGGGDAEPGLEGSGYHGNGFNKLESIEFCGVEGVKEILSNFLWNSQALKTFDISPFRSVSKIHRGFLFHCSSITSIDLSPFANNIITLVDHTFLCGCSSLTTIDLKPFSNVTTIGPYFMMSCTSLTSIDLSPFGKVTSIGTYFMGGCTSLTNVDLTPLVKLKTLPVSFMQGCNVFTPEVRAQFMQSVKDRKEKKKVADADARKVVIKAGGKKK